MKEVVRADNDQAKVRLGTEKEPRLRGMTVASIRAAYAAKGQKKLRSERLVMRPEAITQ